MEILMIGGTVFLGRHIVEAALERGHEVTLFNRGKSGADLFPELERIEGDRKTDLGKLDGRRFDAVVDTCGYHPKEVGASARALADACGHYTYISSLNVYPDITKPGLTEEDPVVEIEGDVPEAMTPETYGALKVLAEREAEAAMPGRVLHVRSGLIVGTWDPSDRFTYWPRRIAAGGEVLAPEKAGRRIQFIDVRDQAEWVLDMSEKGRAGFYNVTGPRDPLTMGEHLQACVRVSGSGATLTWVDEEFLTERGVTPFADLPHWIPGADDGVSVARAVEAGLRFRPLEETIRWVLEWDATMSPDRDLRAGITRERERELLDCWTART